MTETNETDENAASGIKFDPDGDALYLRVPEITEELSASPRDSPVSITLDATITSKGGRGGDGVIEEQLHRYAQITRVLHAYKNEPELMVQAARVTEGGGE